MGKITDGRLTRQRTLATKFIRDAAKAIIAANPNIDREELRRELEAKGYTETIPNSTILGWIVRYKPSTGQPNLTQGGTPEAVEHVKRHYTHHVEKLGSLSAFYEYLKKQYDQLLEEASDIDKLIQSLVSYQQANENMRKLEEQAAASRRRIMESVN